LKIHTEAVEQRVHRGKNFAAQTFHSVNGQDSADTTFDRTERLAKGGDLNFQVFEFVDILANAPTGRFSKSSNQESRATSVVPALAMALA
jgi:hypothetical protein